MLVPRRNLEEWKQVLCILVVKQWKKRQQLTAVELRMRVRCGPLTQMSWHVKSEHFNVVFCFHFPATSTGLKLHEGPCHYIIFKTGQDTTVFKHMAGLITSRDFSIQTYDAVICLWCFTQMNILEVYGMVSYIYSMVAPSSLMSMKINAWSSFVTLTAAIINNLLNLLTSNAILW